MRAVVQRVRRASVSVSGVVKSEIPQGLLILVGIEKDDNDKDIDYMVSKLVGLRIFEDNEGKMNLDIKQAGGEMLLVSQFTLVGDVRKGRRPSFEGAERPEKALPLFNSLVEKVRAEAVNVCLGEFQTHMDVKLVNDGPVTILIDSRKLF